MDTATQILCNGFPRTVASGDSEGLKQTFVHSENEADLFFNANRNSKNIYMNISRFREDMRLVVHDFPFDFDSPMKDSAFSENLTDKQKINQMREDEDLAEEVLGEVWKDVQKLTKYAWKQNIPIISVFSGLGVHSHLLYKEEIEPTEQKITTSQYIIDELDLKTYDRMIITDIKRVLRVPNSKRFDSGQDCDVFCIPMTELEVINNSLHDMLERCKEPKDIEMHSRYLQKNRPQMQVYEDVDVNEKTAGSIPVQNQKVPDNVEYIIDTCIHLPCIRKRFKSKNPHHMVRFNGVVMLYQSGFTPPEVREIIKKIGWMDYDENITNKMTKQIWNRRYSESSCSKLQSLGLCVYGPEFEDMSNDPSDCETYKYFSGKAMYPYDN